MLPSLVSFFCKVDYLLAGRNGGNARTGRHKHPRFLPSSPHQSSRLHLPRRPRTPGPPEQAGQNVLAPPGWGVERGETLAEATAREVNEECGAEITVLASPLGLVEVISPDGGETRHLIQLTYPALLNSRKEPQPSEGTVKETAWFSSYQIGELELHPPIADLLHSWLTTLPDTAALLREPDKAPPFAFPEPRWSP